MVKAPDAALASVTETKKEADAKPKPEDYEIYHDSIGVTHFLSPSRCKNCDD